MHDWKKNLVDDEDGIRQILKDCKRIAVLGIKTDEHAFQPAYYVPKAMQGAGYEVVPVPVYYPEATSILGQKVYRSLAEIPGDIDMVNVFRRPRDVEQHIDDILAKKPRVVWMQSGISNAKAAEAFAKAGIRVVQDR